MPAHRLLIADTPDLHAPDGDGPKTVTVAGDEAHHAAAVRRLRAGEAVELLDGRGLVAEGETARVVRGRDPRIEVAVHAVRTVRPVVPAVQVLTAVPKGDRLEQMVSMLTQVGAASWTPLVCARSVAELTPARRERLKRVAAESLKQSGRAWALKIGEPAGVEEALGAGGAILLADQTGEPIDGGSIPEQVRILIGPEGGWTTGEREASDKAGVVPARFGPHVMRIETAAVAAASLLLARS